jgi:hypothetical protein
MAAMPHTISAVEIQRADLSPVLLAVILTLNVERRMSNIAQRTHIPHSTFNSASPNLDSLQRAPSRPGSRSPHSRAGIVPEQAMHANGRLRQERRKYK